MPPDTSFDVRFREQLVSLCTDKKTIETLASDAGIFWGDVNSDGTPRDAWRSVVQHASQKGKTKSLIAAALERYPKDEVLLELLALDIPSVTRPPDSLTGRQPKPWVLIDRQPQFDDVETTVCGPQDRPTVVIWFGDEGSRVDLLHDRVSSSEFRLSERLARQPDCLPCSGYSDLKKGLQRTCEEFLRQKALVDSSSELKSLLSGRDYSNSLLVIRVDLIWDSKQTVNQIQDIISWCENVGSVAVDRRLVIAVSVEVGQPSGFFSRLFSRPIDELIQNAQRQLAEALSDRGKLLPILPPVRYLDLVHWSSHVQKLLGPRSDDLLGYESLKGIVPPDASRPMRDVVKEVEHIFTNNPAQRA